MQTVTPAYQYQRPPMPHQLECINRSWDKQVFAILFEQGTGKSKVIVDTAAMLFGLGRINTLVIVAPNGVHRKWIEEDFRDDWPSNLPFKWAIWESGNKKSLKACEALLEPGEFLRVLCINVEALSHKTPFEFMKRFVKSTEAMVVVDESSRIKNPDAKRTENLCKIGDYAKYRRILTGTPVSNGPFDYYSQFMYLDTDIFGQSYYAFKAEYAELLDKGDGLYHAIQRQRITKMVQSGVSQDKAVVAANRYRSQVVAKGDDGKPKYKNLDKLKSLIAPYSMRVEKEDVMPYLPPKVFQKRYFKMGKEQQRMYDELVADLKTELNGETATVFHKMTLMLRLAQVASGYIPGDDQKMIRIYRDPLDNPRIQEMLEALQEEHGPVIIWARFQEDIQQIAKVLGDDCVTYYGPDSNSQRAENLRRFKDMEVRYLVGNEVVGGIGLNLTVSAAEIFYNNTFSYEDRKQSEDRIHRKGQDKDSCRYIDLIADGTVDEKTVAALHSKEDMAKYMTNFKEWV